MYKRAIIAILTVIGLTAVAGAVTKKLGLLEDK